VGVRGRGGGIHKDKLYFDQIQQGRFEKYSLRRIILDKIGFIPYFWKSEQRESFCCSKMLCRYINYLCTHDLYGPVRNVFDAG
jgi:hypothetical protein